MSSSVAHFDVAGPDTGRLHRFYGRVFGWQVDEQGPGYALVRTPDGSADGAIVESDDPGLTIGVAVPDLGEALAAAEALGGEVVMPATDNGWVVKGQIADPAGNVITLIQA